MRKGTKGTITNRTIARDMMNMLRPDSLLNISLEQRHILRNEASVQWRKDNPERASEIGIKGGNGCLIKGVGIHALSKEQMSEQGKKNYREGKGIASLTLEQRIEIGKEFGKPNLVGEIICGVCGRTTNKGNYAQSHGDNCRELDKIRLIDALPNIFTSPIIDIIAEKIRILNVQQLNIKHNTCEYTKVDVLVEKPNNFKPQWYKKNIEKIKTFKQNYETIIGKKYEKSVDVISYEDLFSIDEMELQKNIIRDNKKVLSKTRKQYCNTPSAKEHLTKLSRENAEKSTLRKLNRYKKLLEFIPNEQFTSKQFKLICNQLVEHYKNKNKLEELYTECGINETNINAYTKVLLRESTLINQIFKGPNQFNSSIYKKIK